MINSKMARSKPFYFLLCKIDNLYIISDIQDMKYLIYNISKFEFDIISYLRYFIPYVRYLIYILCNSICKISFTI